MSAAVRKLLWATLSVPLRQARKNIERMLREAKIDLDVCCTHQRFTVRLLNVNDLTAITNEEGE